MQAHCFRQTDIVYLHVTTVLEGFNLKYLDMWNMTHWGLLLTNEYLLLPTCCILQFQKDNV